jgi:hypothetical protein
MNSAFSELHHEVLFTLLLTIGPSTWLHPDSCSMEGHQIEVAKNKVSHIRKTFKVYCKAKIVDCDSRDFKSYCKKLAF